MINYLVNIGRKVVKFVPVVAGVAILGLGGTAMAQSLDAAAVGTEITAGKTAAATVLGGVAAVWGLFILAKLLRRGSKQVAIIGAVMLALGHSAMAQALDAAAVGTEITAGKTAAATVLGGVAAVWGLFILAKLLRRGSKQV
jgi:hypothetical protein